MLPNSWHIDLIRLCRWWWWFGCATWEPSFGVRMRLGEGWGGGRGWICFDTSSYLCWFVFIFVSFLSGRGWRGWRRRGGGWWPSSPTCSSHERLQQNGRRLPSTYSGLLLLRGVWRWTGWEGRGDGREFSHVDMSESLFLALKFKFKLNHNNLSWTGLDTFWHFLFIYLSFFTCTWVLYSCH